MAYRIGQKTHRKAEETDTVLPVVAIDHPYGSSYLYGHVSGVGGEMQPLGYLADQVFLLDGENSITGRVMFPSVKDWGRNYSYKLRSLWDHNLIDEGSLSLSTVHRPARSTL